MGGSYSKQVTIKLLEKPKDTEYHAYPEETDLIKVTRDTYPPGSRQDFYRYTHGWNGTQYKLAEIQDDSGYKINISGLKDVTNVSSVEAYYWQHDRGVDRKPEKALLVEIVQNSSPTKKYYYLRNINKTVTIDLTKSNSKPGNRYCCPDHTHTKRISVTEQRVSCKTHPGSATFFKHTINDSEWRVAAIKYNDGGGRSTGKRKRIKIPDLILPTNKAVTVKVYSFYCSKKNPVLIYVESSGGQDVKGWYKQDLSNGDGKLWTKVTDLSSITPDDFSKLDCSNNKNFKELAKTLRGLGCKGLEQCTIDTEHLGQDGVQREEVQKTAEQQTQQEEQERDRPQQQQTGSKPFSGPSAGAKAGISIASVGGVGIAAVTIWKWPSIMSFLIARI